MLDFSIQESDDLLRELQGLESGLQQKALNYILGQAANPITKQARRDAPVGETGALKKSIGRKKLNRKERAAYKIKNGVAAVGIGAVKKVRDGAGRKRFQDYKLRWLEEGTKPHRLYKGPKSAARAKINRVLIGGKWVRIATIKHPGVKKNPFLSRAFARHQSKLPDRTMAGLKKWLKKNAPRQLNSVT